MQTLQVRLSNLNQLVKRGLVDSVSPVVEDDRNYLLMRAEQEEAIAARSMDEAVKRAHLGLAAAYRRTALDFCPRFLPLDRAAQPLPVDPTEPHSRQP